MRKMMLFVALCMAAQTFGQTENLGSWSIYFGSIRPEGTKISLDPELQYRNHELTSDLQQFLVRPMLKYQILPNLNLGAGYAHIVTEKPGKPNIPQKENRITQEALLSQTTGIVALRHRFRFEQRFTENKAFNTRYRYCLFIDIPLNKKKIEPKTAYVALYNEVFIHGKKTEDTPQAFDRNRIYLGSGYRFSKNLALQLGWMNQIQENNSKAQLLFSIHHILPIGKSRT